MPVRQAGLYRENCLRLVEWGFADPHAFGLAGKRYAWAGVASGEAAENNEIVKILFLYFII